MNTKQYFGVVTVLALAILNAAYAAEMPRACGMFDSQSQPYCVAHKVYDRSSDDPTASVGPFVLASVNESATQGLIRRPGSTYGLRVNPHRDLAVDYGCGKHSAICVGDIVTIKDYKKYDFDRRIKSVMPYINGLFMVIGIYEYDGADDHFALASCDGQLCLSTSEWSDKPYGRQLQNGRLFKMDGSNVSLKVWTTE